MFLIIYLFLRKGGLALTLGKELKAQNTSSSIILKRPARTEKQNTKGLISLYRAKNLLEMIDSVVFSRITDP